MSRLPEPSFRSNVGTVNDARSKLSFLLVFLHRLPWRLSRPRPFGQLQCLLGGRDISHEFNADVDCAGSCFGGGSLDTCGDCTGPDTSLLFDQNRDCSGVCGGPFRSDSCGVCRLPEVGGAVDESRDCAGVCFGSAVLDQCGTCHGGSTGLPPDAELDACGVCGGNNSSCLGCDGGVANGLEVDRCGQCGGGNCGCFLLTSATPDDGGPTSGGTQVLVEGAGLFLNDSALLGGFRYDPALPNCGAPTRFPNGLAVRVTCRFTAEEGSEVLQVSGEVVDQGAVRCLSQPSTTPGGGPFSLQVSVNNGPRSNPIPFRYRDHSTVVLRSVTPVQWPVNSAPVNITFRGDDFIVDAAPFVSCLLYDAHACSDPPSSPPLPGVSSFERIPAVFVAGRSEVICTLPPAATPCRVRVRLTFDGQESGRVESDSVDFVFTYRASAPRVTEARFLDDLSGLLIRFDRSAEVTDDDGTPLSTIACEGVFDVATLDLIGGSGAVCSWADNRQDAIRVVFPRSANVIVGSPITFRNSAIQARNALYSFSITDVTVAVSSDAVQQPLAVITGPDSIPSCGSFSFSGLHSQHPGYSGFRYRWTILVRDSTTPGYTEIANYLDALGTDASEIALNSTHFLEGVVYSVQLQVVNGVGLESEVTSLELRKNSRPGFQVVLLGPTQRALRAGEGLLAEAVVREPDCGDLRLAGNTFQFRWELTRILDERRGLLAPVDIAADARTGSPQVMILASRFVEGAQYTLQLSVTSRSGATAGEEERVELGVTVLPSLPSVQLHAGSNRIVSTTAGEVLLDARNSSYSAVLPPPSFSWLCTVLDSLDACYNQSNTSSFIPQPIYLPGDSLISFPASSLAPGRSYRFMLKLEQEGIVDEGSVVVGVVNPRVPMVEISPPMSKFLLSEEVILSGFVYSETSLRDATWSSVQQEGRCGLRVGVVRGCGYPPCCYVVECY